MAPTNATPASLGSSPIKYDVKHCSMGPEIERVAVEIILEALGNCKIEKDAATVIKRGMDGTSSVGGTWHCIVGNDFGASLCFDNKHLLFLKTADKHVLLFRSFDHV